jgi:hypothetical protein
LGSGGSALVTWEPARLGARALRQAKPTAWISQRGTPTIRVLVGLLSSSATAESIEISLD